MNVSHNNKEDSNINIFIFNGILFYQESGDFTSIPLEVDPEQPIKKKKVPRRLIHCSDGVLEEYSTDEEEEVKPPEPTVNPVRTSIKF